MFICLETKLENITEWKYLSFSQLLTYRTKWQDHENRLKTQLNLWIWISILFIKSSFKSECGFSFVLVFVWILPSPSSFFLPDTHTFIQHIKFIHTFQGLIVSIKHSEYQRVTFVSKQRMSICFQAHPSGSSQKLLLAEEAWCFIQLYPSKNISGY